MVGFFVSPNVKAYPDMWGVDSPYAEGVSSDGTYLTGKVTIAGGSFQTTVTLVDAMPDTQYHVVLEEVVSTLGYRYDAIVVNKAVGSFTVQLSAYVISTDSVDIEYTLFK